MSNYKTIVMHGPGCGDVHDVICEDHKGNLCVEAAREFHKIQVDVYGLDPDEEWWCAFNLGDCDETVDAIVDGFGWVKVRAAA